MERQLARAQSNIVRNEAQVQEALRVQKLVIDELPKQMEPMAIAQRVREGHSQEKQRLQELILKPRNDAVGGGLFRFGQ